MGDSFPGEDRPARGEIVYDQIWFWKTKLPERKGQRCRVIARGAMNNVCVEFEDGYKVITGRYAVRPAPFPIVQPIPESTLELARRAVKSNAERSKLLEDPVQRELWAKNLAKDLVDMGEAEYGR